MSTDDRSWTRWVPWVAVLGIVAVALLVGTVGQSEPTDEKRAQNLAATIRCPSCKSQSVAGSDTASSLAIRSLIADRIEAGDSDEQIRDFVASSYPGGQELLLEPSGSGFSAVVWALPVMVVIVAVVGLVFRFRDWRPGDRTSSQADRDLVAGAMGGVDGEQGSE